MRSRKPFVTSLLLLLMVSALGLGAWLSLSPTIEKKQALSQQQALLEDFEAVRAESSVDLLNAEASPNSTFQTPPSTLNEGILTIDRLDMKLPVVNSVAEEQLKIAVGHVPETASIGSEGNAVVIGHRSLTYGQYFNRLGEAEPGDFIRYEDRNGAVFTYEVFQLMEIEPDDQTAFVQPDGEYWLTLYSCTPIRTATHRLLVRGKLVGEGNINEAT